MAWNRLLLLFAFSFITFTGNGQVSPSPKYWITFTDKDHSNFSISNPSAFLSQRALDRRNNQGISITYDDLPVTQLYIDSVLNHGQADLHCQSKWMNGIVVTLADTAYLDSIINLAFVSGHQQVRTKKINPDRPKLEEKFYNPKSEVFNADYGYSFSQIAMLNGHWLHKESYKGAGKLIAVLDAGFYKVDEYTAFDHLFEHNRILATYDFVDRNSEVYNDHTHGMHVLSALAAKIPYQLHGTATESEYLLLKTEDAFSEYIIEEYNWIAALEYADSAGADIVNSSLGYTTFEDTATSHEYSDLDGQLMISRAAEMAADRGILVVNSAGNYGDGAWQYIGVPADAFNILAVGAVDPERNRTEFSSIGPSADGRIKPDLMAQGRRAALFSHYTETAGFGDGTSFAAPLVAGMAACLWEAHPELTSLELRELILKSCDRYHQPDNSYGHGIPDFYKAHLMASEQGYPTVRNDQLLKVYPNPVQTSLYVEFYSTSNQDGIVYLRDEIGRLVLDQDISLNKGYNVFGLQQSIRDIQSGIYLLEIKVGESSFVQKVICDN